MALRATITGGTSALRRHAREVLVAITPLLVHDDVALDVHLVTHKTMNANVHSFLAPLDFPRPDIAPARWLGDIYINPSYIKQHYEDFNLLLVHGFLHLLGYDHGRKSDRLKMESRERMLLRHIGSL